MQRRFGNIEANLHLAKSTILDPRFQKLAFRNNAERQGVQTLVQELETIRDPVAEPEQNVAEVTPVTDLLWSEFDSKVSNLDSTQQQTHKLFWPDENNIEQCCAAHIVQGCQQY